MSTTRHKKIVNFENTTDNENHPGVRDVSPEEVFKEKDNIHLIDVRRPDEYTGRLGHIPGAELLTFDFLPQKLKELPKDATLVFICHSGNRSGQATAFAQEHGFDKVYNMRGGMVLWNQLNFETES